MNRPSTALFSALRRYALEAAPEKLAAVLAEPVEARVAKTLCSWRIPSLGFGSGVSIAKWKWLPATTQANGRQRARSRASRSSFPKPTLSPPPWKIRER